jgi:hypothetical protein
MANVSLTQAEPLYYGKGHGDVKEGLSAEEFVSRVDASTSTIGANARQAAEFAAGKLRGAAYMWWNEVLPYLNPTAKATASVDIAQFWALFRARYFTIQTARDVSSEWATLTRKDGERPTDFASRVIAGCGKLVPFLPQAGVTAALVTECNDAVTVYAAAEVARTANDVVATQQAADLARAAVTDSITALLIDKGNNQNMAVIQRIMLKILASGARNAKVREEVRKQEADFVSMDDLFEKLRVLEKELPDHTWKNGGNGKGNGHSAQFPVSQDQDAPEPLSDDEQEGVDAVKPAKKFGKAKKAKQASKPSTPNPPAQPPAKFNRWDRSKPPPPEAGPCPKCKKSGHWAFQCKQSTPVQGETAQGATVWGTSQWLPQQSGNANAGM